MSVVKTWMLLLVPALLAVPPALRAQLEPISQPAPLMPGVSRPAPGPGLSLEREAHLALNIGLPSIAAELFRKIFDDPATSAEVRNRVAIHLATALIEEDRFSEAAKVLQKFTGLPTAALRLRQAMIAVRERRFDAAKAEAQAINPDEFTAPYDRGWYFFLRGQLAGDAQQAGAFYQQADDAAAAAGLEAQRAWFLLAKRKLKLQAGDVTDRNVTAWQKIIGSSAGTAQAYEATSQLAVGLAQLGQRPQAIALLQSALLPLSKDERAYRDEWQLLLGLIAGPDDSAGWVALRNLLINSTDRDRQRVALRLMFRASRAGARRDEFSQLLNELISAPSPHPILEYLLLFRAQTALSDNANKRYPQAEEDATRLLKEFPNSALKAVALGVLTEAAWEQGLYRRAATHAAAARAELPAGETRAQLGVLQAEAYFRAAEIGKTAADYRTAADAYGAALAEVPAGVPPGDLMFQRVLSAINAGQLDEAERILDELARDPRLDASYRWQMEWNLARALQVAGAAPKAYERVNRLLDNALTSAGLPEDLRASMAWLQARLAFENNDPARTLALGDTLMGSLDGVASTLKAEIASNTLLLQAQAGFALKNRERAKSALDRLKKDYPTSDAAIYSYIVEADAADADGLVLDAQKLVVDLADKFEKSEYAPYALYRAALYAARRGPNRQDYVDANQILERLVTKYPDDDLVFYARLKQGNLLREMNEYGRARTLYAALVNKFTYPQFADALSAQIALADTEATLAASDPSRASNAASIYERLYDLPSAPIDLRAEAGHKLGLYRAEREPENPERAYAIWWPMIEAFVLDETKAAKLGANGRYWMSRTILKLAAFQESRSKPREARQLYELILEKKLPGTLLANDGLTRTGGKPAATTNGAAR
ncbi:hypothetical protein CMV30_05255 [Nibricoccus aquaticus]|uniref:Tetratricopeptide repeat-like domain-containing protein n=2 Tax=Nibricoccus aquaticus TaxID=2576891 RepID=A0A290QB02_9BACT|nr:hypothetical protein CMV30_05255 [Nibricoccus aquaticus]